MEWGGFGVEGFEASAGFVEGAELNADLCGDGSARFKSDVWSMKSTAKITGRGERNNGFRKIQQFSNCHSSVI